MHRTHIALCLLVLATVGCNTERKHTFEKKEELTLKADGGYIRTESGQSTSKGGDYNAYRGDYPGTPRTAPPPYSGYRYNGNYHNDGYYNSGFGGGYHGGSNYDPTYEDPDHYVVPSPRGQHVPRNSGKVRHVPHSPNLRHGN
jgi:hypothetical protein